MGTHANIAFPRRLRGWQFLAVVLWLGGGPWAPSAWSENPLRYDLPPAIRSQVSAPSGRPGGRFDAAPAADFSAPDFVPADLEMADWVEGADGPCDSYPCDRLWVRPELLAWWVQGFSVPALVTTSVPGTTRLNAGRLDQRTTTVLFGDDTVGNSGRSAGRIRFGFWFDPSKTAGLEASYLGASSETTNFSDSSANTPIIARPFFNVEPDFVGQDSELVAYPGFLQGSIQVSSKSTFETLEVLYRRTLSQGPCEVTDLLVGYRYVRLADQLSISDSKTSIATSGGIAVGTTLEELDQFNASNRFHGAEFGVVHQKYWGPWMCELTAKIALGTTNVQTSIRGQTTVTVPIPGTAPDLSVTETGLLAQRTNIGVRQNDVVSVIPEVGLLMGYDVREDLRLTVGYTFMYWSSVTRAGGLIDPQLNLSQLTPGGLTGPARPAYVTNDNGVWAQGLSLGLDYRF